MVPVLGFTCGSSSSRLTRARALGRTTSKLSTRKNKRRPLPGLAQWGLVNEGCSHFPAHVLDLSFECCHIGHGDEHSGGNPFSNSGVRS
jgi:hypothetical protein